MACFARWARTNDGTVEPDARFWRQRLLERPWDDTFRAVVVDDGGRITGVASFTRKADASGHLDIGFGLEHLVFVTEDARALDAMIAYARGHRGVGRWLQWVGPPNDPLTLLVGVQAVEVHQRYRWMLRLLDVPAAFAGRGYPAIDAEATFAVEDPRYPANAGPWTLEVRGGSASVRPAAGPRPAPDPDHRCCPRCSPATCDRPTPSGSASSTPTIPRWMPSVRSSSGPTRGARSSSSGRRAGVRRRPPARRARPARSSTASRAPSPFHRGIRCRCRWNSTCQPAAALAWNSVMPSGCRRSRSSGGHVLPERPHGASVLGIDVPDVDGVALRDHEGVPLGRRVDVEERECAVGLGDPVRRRRPGDDRAEDAARVAHRGQSCSAILIASSAAPIRRLSAQLNSMSASSRPGTCRILPTMAPSPPAASSGVGNTSCCGIVPELDARARRPGARAPPPAEIGRANSRRSTRRARRSPARGPTSRPRPGRARTGSSAARAMILSSSPEKPSSSSSPIRGTTL